MIKIKTLHFNDYEEFVCAIADKYDKIKNNDDLSSVDIIAKYYDAKEIIRELVSIGYEIAFMNEFAAPEWDYYDDAFVIGVYDDGIWVEPVKREKGYISIEADTVYIFDDCNSKILSNVEANEKYEVAFDEDCDYDNCEHDKSSSTYKVNGETVDKNTYEMAVSSIEDKYLSSMRDMLLKYAEFMDEMNEWNRLLFC